MLSTKYVHSTVQELPDDERWRTALPELLHDFSALLRDALDLMRELGEADDNTDRSYVHHPSITEHPQNMGFHDWTALIDLTRDAWRATAAQSPDRARLAAQGWRHIRYPLFRRLTFFAASDTELIPHRLGLTWLLEDERWWLWSVETTRETIRLLVALVPELDEAELLELESAILTGPPRNMYRENIDEELWTQVRDREIWLRLARIAETRGRLSPAGEKVLTGLSAQYPNWKLSEDERDEFHHWMDDGEELRTFVRSPREPTELVEWLKTYRTSDFWEEDDWRDRCREDFPTTAWALSTLAEQGEWPSTRWGTALHAWSEGNLIAPAWEQMAPVLETAPPEFLKEVDHRAQLVAARDRPNISGAREDVSFALRASAATRTRARRGDRRRRGPGHQSSGRTRDGCATSLVVSEEARGRTRPSQRAEWDLHGPLRRRG